jgi:hypothetical protein
MYDLGKEKTFSLQAESFGALCLSLPIDDYKAKSVFLLNYILSLSKIGIIVHSFCFVNSLELHYIKEFFAL